MVAGNLPLEWPSHFSLINLVPTIVKTNRNGYRLDIGVALQAVTVTVTRRENGHLRRRPNTLIVPSYAHLTTPPCGITDDGCGRRIAVQRGDATLLQTRAR